MTVSSTSSRVVFNGDGSTTAWPVAFKIPDSSAIVAVYTDVNGDDHTLSYGSDYTAIGFGSDLGVTVTYPMSGSPITHGTQLTIYRNVAVTQPTSISNQGAMWPQVIEAALDRLTFIAQKVTDGLSRSLVISPTDGGATLFALPNVTQRKNSFLAFDDTGQPIAASGVSDTAVAAAMKAFVQSASLAVARALLGAFGLADNNAPSGNMTPSAGTWDLTGTAAVRVATQGPSDNSTKAASTAYVDHAVAAAGLVRSYLAGLTLTNDAGTPNTRLDVAAGVCADDTNAMMLSLAAKVIDCTTTGANGLDVGSLANSTTYHVFALGKTDGTTAALASTSVSSPTMPSGYSLKRRIGSFKTDASAHIRSFAQDGDLVMWSVPSGSPGAFANPGTSAVDRTMDVPTGIQVHAVFQAILNNTGSGVYPAAYFSDKATTDTPASGVLEDLTPVSNTAGGSQLAGARLSVRTDTAARIRSRLSASDGSTTLILNTLGWVDRRGRDT